jgi:hypothetical protein
VAATVGTDIGRAVDVVGTSSSCWILAAAALTLDSTLAVGSGTMDVVDAMRTSSRRVIDVMGNSSRRRVRLGIICIFSNYGLRIKFFVNIMQL